MHIVPSLSPVVIEYRQSHHILVSTFLALSWPCPPSPGLLKAGLPGCGPGLLYPSTCSRAWPGGSQARTVTLTSAAALLASFLLGPEPVADWAPTVTWGQEERQQDRRMLPASRTLSSWASLSQPPGCTQAPSLSSPELGNGRKVREGPAHDLAPAAAVCTYC